MISAQYAHLNLAENIIQSFNLLFKVLTGLQNLNLSERWFEIFLGFSNDFLSRASMQGVDEEVLFPRPLRTFTKPSFFQLAICKEPFQCKGKDAHVGGIMTGRKSKPAINVICLCVSL